MLNKLIALYAFILLMFPAAYAAPVEFYIGGIDAGQQYSGQATPSANGKSYAIATYEYDGSDPFLTVGVTKRQGDFRFTGGLSRGSTRYIAERSQEAIADVANYKTEAEKFQTLINNIDPNTEDKALQADLKKYTDARNAANQAAANISSAHHGKSHQVSMYGEVDVNVFDYGSTELFVGAGYSTPISSDTDWEDGYAYAKVTAQIAGGMEVGAMHTESGHTGIYTRAHW